MPRAAFFVFSYKFVSKKTFCRDGIPVWRPAPRQHSHRIYGGDDEPDIKDRHAGHTGQLRRSKMPLSQDGYRGIWAHWGIKRHWGMPGTGGYRTLGQMGSQDGLGGAYRALGQQDGHWGI